MTETDSVRETLSTLNIPQTTDDPQQNISVHICTGFLSVKFIIVMTKFRVTIATSWLALTRCMKLNYAVGHERARSTLFQAIITILWVGLPKTLRYGYRTFSILLSHDYGWVTNNNGVLDWKIGFINTFLYNYSESQSITIIHNLQPNPSSLTAEDSLHSRSDLILFCTTYTVSRRSHRKHVRCLALDVLYCWLRIVVDFA
jgi:hypothetical protein